MALRSGARARAPLAASRNDQASIYGPYQLFLPERLCQILDPGQILPVQLSITSSQQNR